MAYTNKAPLEGSLQEVLLPHIFIKILMMNLTGILVIYADDRTFDVYFRKGQVVHVSSDHEEDRFGTFLVRMGVLSDLALGDMLKQQKTLSNTKIGHLLIQQDIVQPHLVSQYLNDFHAQRLHEVFAVKSGSYRYVKNSQWREDISVFSMPTYNIFFEAIERFYTTKEIEEKISLHKDCLIQKNNKVTLPFPLPGLASKVYNSLAKEITINDLIAQTKVDSHKVLSSIFILVVANLVEVLPSKTSEAKGLPQAKLTDTGKKQLEMEYATFIKKDFFELFSVPFQLNPQKVQAQFFSLMKQFKKYEGESKGDEMIRWTKVGYFVLLHKKIRIDYIQRLKAIGKDVDKLQSDRHFFYGLSLIQKKQTQTAFDEFKVIFEKDPKNILYRVYYWGTKYELDPGKDNLKTTFSIFERNQNVVLSESYLTYIYAMMLINKDEHDRAKKILKHALEKNPDFDRARILLDDMRIEMSKQIQVQQAINKQHTQPSRLKKFLFKKIGPSSKHTPPVLSEEDERLPS